MPSARVVPAQRVPPVTHSCRHAVQFYEKDDALIETLGKHIGEALAAGDVAIVVATKAHRTGLAKELQRRRISTAAAVHAGRFIQLDPSETLAKFMVGGGPDKEKFENVIGGIIRRAETNVRPGGRMVVYGEMVAILWAEGKRDATIRLEELWNDLAERHTFYLLCGYPVSAFDRMEHRQLFFSICGEHTHVNPAESYPAQGSEVQRRRSVAKLQQKSNALEAEIRISQERLRLLQQVTKVGTWELDITTDIFSFSSAAAKLLGLKFSSRIRLGQLMDLMYYSGDRENVFAQLQGAQRHRKDFGAKFRIRQGEETRMIAIQGRTFYNSGFPIMLGVLSDVTPAPQNPGVPGKNSDKTVV